MALILKVDPTITVSSDCADVTVSDGTGDYDAGTNPGGYGAPNTVRGEIALYMQAYSYNNDASVNVKEILTSTDNPLAVTAWQYKPSIDGYYKFRIIGAKAWDIAVAYMAENIIYFVGGSAATTGLYQAIQNSTGETPEANPTYWAMITTTELNNADVDAEDLLEASELQDYFLACNSAVCYSKATVQLTSGIVGSCNCDTNDMKDWQNIHALYNGMLVLIEQDQQYDAQKVAQFMEDVCEEANCDCGC
jgi:hypothetical protein